VAEREKTNADDGDKKAVFTVFIVDTTAFNDEPTPSGNRC